MANAEITKLLSEPTAPVPEVGRICFGLSRGASYEAAKRGDFPVIKIGRLLKVPTAWVRKRLQLEADESQL